MIIVNKIIFNKNFILLLNFGNKINKQLVPLIPKLWDHFAEFLRDS